MNTREYGIAVEEYKGMLMSTYVQATRGFSRKYIKIYICHKHRDILIYKAVYI